MDFNIKRGDTRTFRLRVYQKNVKEETFAVDITGFSIWFTAKKSLATVDASAEIRKSTALGTITLDEPSMGKCSFNLINADTSGFPDVSTELFYDVKLMDVGGDIETVVSGKMTVLPNVTLSTT